MTEFPPVSMILSFVDYLFKNRLRSLLIHCWNSNYTVGVNIAEVQYQKGLFWVRNFCLAWHNDLGNPLVRFLWNLAWFCIQEALPWYHSVLTGTWMKMKYLHSGQCISGWNSRSDTDMRPARNWDNNMFQLSNSRQFAYTPKGVLFRFCCQTVLCLQTNFISFWKSF